jgi:hypothetical protein
MAKATYSPVPLDQPREIRPGVMHRETDWQGSGKWYALPPEAPERAAKGDLGLSTIKDFESRPLTSAGLPFRNLRGGK